MNGLAVSNTENKIYNEIRRSYLDDSDCKEGEVICRKCKGTGINYTHPFTHPCSKCAGNGIVDWVTQAVDRPVVMPTDSSSSASISSGGMRRPHGMSGPTYRQTLKLPKPKNKLGNLLSKVVTNYKRRKIV